LVVREAVMGDDGRTLASKSDTLVSLPPVPLTITVVDETTGEVVAEKRLAAPANHDGLAAKIPVIPPVFITTSPTWVEPEHLAYAPPPSEPGACGYAD
jgi:hypothetical protein